MVLAICVHSVPKLGCARRRRRAAISQYWVSVVAAEVEEVGMSSYSARARQPRPAWWLRLASSSPYRPQYTIADRERARRSDLIAWLALGMFGVVLIVSPIAIDDTQALLVYLGFVLALILIIALNRIGQITLAGGLLVSCVTGAVFAYMLSSPLGLTMGQLPNYDALAVGVVVAASVLPRTSGFVVAAINSGLIVADYLLRPHNANIAADAALYSSVTQQTVSLLVRPIALQFIFAVIAYLWVRGTDRAIRRADRAEEIAALEAMELERTRILEEGVGYVRQTIARWVRGDLKARVPIMPVPALRNMCDDLNGFIIAFSYLSNADYHLRRLQGDVSNLTIALRQWMAGGTPQWPLPSGTALDDVLEILAELRRRAYAGAHPRAAPPQDAP
jgi:hypothetical protein